MTDSDESSIPVQNEGSLPSKENPDSGKDVKYGEILEPEKRPDLFDILHCFPNAKSIVDAKDSKDRLPGKNTPAPARSYTPGKQQYLWDTIPALWKSDTMRPLPNPTIRGSLFGLIKRGQREMLRDFEVYSDKNVRITYTGISLGQDDLDVWMYILQKSGQRFIDPKTEYTVLEFSITQFLKAIGWKSVSEGRPAGGKDKKWLMDSLARIGNGSIRVYAADGREYTSTLINEAAWDPKLGKLFIGMNARIGYFFSAQITLLSTETRGELAGDQLALWLYNFITSNKSEKYIVYSVENLMTRCRSTIKEPRMFKHKLQEKLNRLMSDFPEKERNFHAWAFSGNNVIIFYNPQSYAAWKVNPTLRLL